MKLFVLYFSFSLYCLAICGQELNKIRVDPAQVYGGTASDYFQDIEYIPLETTKESLFGATHNMIITESTIVVGDFDTKCVLFFNLKGKFIKKHFLGKEAVFRLTYDYDRKLIAAEIFSFETETTTIKYYTIKGELIKTDKQKYSYYSRTEKIVLDSGFYAFYKYKRIPIKDLPLDINIPLVSVYNSKDSLYKVLLKMKPEENPLLFAGVGGVSFSANMENKSSAFIVLPYDYRFFMLSKDTLKLMGQFVFPANYVIQEKIVKSKNYKVLDSIRKAMSMDFHLVQSIKDISFYNNKMLFRLEKIITLMPDANGMIYDPINFMYDTVSKKVISFERITSDSLSHYLPLMDGFSSINGMKLNNGTVYSSVSSLNMFRAKNETENKNPIYPTALLNYFKSGNRKSNPVIVKMKLKE